MKPTKPTYQKYTPPKKVYKSWLKASENKQFTPLPKEFLYEEETETNEELYEYPQYHEWSRLLPH